MSWPVCPLPWSCRLAAALACFLPLLAAAQPLGQPDRGAPGDEMIQKYLRAEAQKISDSFAGDIRSRAEWQTRRAKYEEQYLYMLGLFPRPEKTPLQPRITGTLQQDGYTVDNLHFQSLPKLYVTANLYRPAPSQTNQRHPAVLYVCGHSHRGRNGNKVAYQSHGIWLARHGYVCLVVDSLQLGEIAATHHGTYREQRWWWHSRGYTPAGVETWNGIRAIDYLVSRDDVDPARIAVTGISGGGAASFWIAAADSRVAVAVPVSGMADLDSYVGNRVINGHCDCMFLYNAYQWPWTRIAGLIAPRPLLFVNSDQDEIFPMDANERIANRLERLYSLYGASDQFDAVVSVGGHAYRHDIRQAAYRFLQTHLQTDPRPIGDSERDIVSEGNDPGAYPIAPERLRVFPRDEDLPADQINTAIDRHFVPIAQPAVPPPANWAAQRSSLLKEMREVSFGYFPPSIPAARPLAPADENVERLASEPNIDFRLRYADQALPGAKRRMLLVVLGEDEAGTTPAWLTDVAKPDQQVVFCEPRGIGSTRWTRSNPPNYVERSHALLGRTVDTGRVWDVAAAAAYLQTRLNGRDTPPAVSVDVAGRGGAGIIAAYAALWTPAIDAITLVAPPATHMDAAAPQFLNVLRVCDLPDTLGMLAPKSLTIREAKPADFARTKDWYDAADAAGRLTIR